MPCTLPSSAEMTAMKNAVRDTRVLISFGVAGGGMEFVTQLRRDIYDAKAPPGYGPDTNPQYIYLDAYSLKGLAGSRIAAGMGQLEIEGKIMDVELDFARFANPYWAIYFNCAMAVCKTMIFLVSKQWLLSPFCWEEFYMYERLVEDGEAPRPLMMVFPDAVPHMSEASFMDRSKKVRCPKAMEECFSTQPGYFRINTSKQPSIGNQVKLPSGTTWEYTYNYSITEQELESLISHIVVY